MEFINNPYINTDAVSDDMRNVDGEIGLIGKRFIDPEKTKFTWKNIQDAKEWSEKSLLAIIYPTNDIDALEKCYDDYMLMAHPLRRKADTACVEFFGMECEDLYDLCKNSIRDGRVILIANESASINEEKMEFSMPFYKRYMQKVHTESNLDIAYSASRLLYNDGNRYNEKLISNCISDVINNHKEEMDDIEIYPDLPNDCPMFTPEEMIDFGVFSDVDADNYFNIQSDNTILEDLTSVKEWFESYKSAFYGLDESTFASYSKAWTNTVRTLCRELKQFKEAGDILRVKSRMQSILELGWNPHLDFNATNRTTAHRRLNEIASIKSNKYQIVDITSMEPIAEASEDNIEESDKVMVPVFISLIGGENAFSAAIKAFTHSKYSHVAISFDPNMDKIYSFGMKQKASTKNLDGFTIENIRKYGKKVNATIYTFFVKPVDFVKMKTFVEKFANDPDRTHYSYLNILALIFKIPLDRGDSYICSQFIDKVLKVADIDLTNKNSSFVSPEDFHKASENNKGKIYKVFDDMAYKFKTNTLIKKVNTLMRTATLIREAVVFDDDIGFIRATFENVNDISALKYLSSNLDKINNPQIKRIYEEFIDPIFDVQPIREARSFPIQFDKNGDLILKNIWDIDIDREYNTSHKILMSCSSTNLDSMKYEIAKLWMLNLIVEKKISKGDNSDTDLKKLSDQRARILNDFNKYLKIIMKNDPDFVFGEYFEESPFNAGAIKITGTTVKYGADLLKSVILGRKFL